MASKKTSVRTPKRAGDKRGKNPASLANLKPPWRAGDPSPNPSGRPKLLGDSYKAMLARVNESDPHGRTNAELIANAALVAALGGDVSAMREIRSATEGERIRTWRDEIIDALRDELITPEQVTNALGDELAGEIFIAAGLRRNANGETAGGRAGTTPGGAAK